MRQIPGRVERAAEQLAGDQVPDPRGGGNEYRGHQHSPEPPRKGRQAAGEEDTQNQEDEDIRRNGGDRTHPGRFGRSGEGEQQVQPDKREQGKQPTAPARFGRRPVHGDLVGGRSGR